MDKSDDNLIANVLDRSQLIALLEERVQCGDYRTATFWAEKLMALGARRFMRERLPDFARYLSVINADHNWQTIVTFIRRHELLLAHLSFSYFYVNALFHRQLHSDIVQLPLGHLRRWDDVPYIAPENIAYIHIENNFDSNEEAQKELDEYSLKHKHESQLLLLLAKTYLIVQNRPAASGCLFNCLKLDPFCSEALHLAIESRLIPIDKIRCQIYTSAGDENSAVLVYFKQILDIYDINMVDHLPPSTSFQLCDENDLTVQATTAFRLYSQCKIFDAYRITSSIFHNFGYYEKCILVHIGCLVNLGKANELYALGHEMVQLQPENAVTWYTVGSYYYATSQYTTAKKFYNKCTSMNAGFGEGWLAYGHSLYHVDEHEQAMNCYLRATRILEDQFEPLLYIAVEYCFSNNFKLANSFLHDAEELAHQNAMVLHERATVAFMERNFEKAESLFTSVLRQVTLQNGVELDSIEAMLSVEVSDFWEPVFNNLGHTLRKLGRFDQAINVHRKSLVLAKNKAEAWSCIGVCYASMDGLNSDHIDSAINALNNALVLKPGDDLLKAAFEKLLNIISQTPLQDCILEGGEENFNKLIEERQQRRGVTKRVVTSSQKVTPETEFQYSSLINAPSKTSFSPAARIKKAQGLEYIESRKKSLRTRPTIAK